MIQNSGLEILLLEAGFRPDLAEQIKIENAPQYITERILTAEDNGLILFEGPLRYRVAMPNNVKTSEGPENLLLSKDSSGGITIFEYVPDIAGARNPVYNRQTFDDITKVEGRVYESGFGKAGNNLLELTLLNSDSGKVTLEVDNGGSAVLYAPKTKLIEVEHDGLLWKRIGDAAGVSLQLTDACSPLSDEMYTRGYHFITGKNTIVCVGSVPSDSKEYEVRVIFEGDKDFSFAHGLLSGFGKVYTFSEQSGNFLKVNFPMYRGDKVAEFLSVLNQN